MKSLLICLFFLSYFNAFTFSQSIDNQANTAYFKTLLSLGEALLKVQNQDKKSPDFGGLQDPETGIYYSRAAEAVFPFAVLWQKTQDKKYLKSAINLGNWLIRQQKPSGEWVENPWTWTGTTADQLLMMAGAYPILKSQLTDKEQVSWKKSISAAADYLVLKMSPDFASINYVPTTAGALAVTYQNIEPRETWKTKAQTLAFQTRAKMDDDFFIEGEAARYHDNKYGVDLSYQIDMSLWGLALYARIFKDEEALQAVQNSLQRIQYFVYPNGMIDGSWGARCYKWTGYGTKTADGCQVLFSLFAQENPVYQAIALRNLEYLQTAIQDGLVGYGKHIWGMPNQKANLYPTFARAKNLAMAVAWGQTTTQSSSLPADTGNWHKYFPTLKVGIIRQGIWMATVSAYDYEDRDNWGKGKYHHNPRGGALCNVYAEGFGWLTTSSQTRYQRGEYVHMPEIQDSIQCLTPRLEYQDQRGYFTNLYDSKTDIFLQSLDNQLIAKVNGELCDSLSRPGGVAFGYDYVFENKKLTKNLRLRYHGRNPIIQIVEPIVLEVGVKIEKIDEKTVKIHSAQKQLIFKVHSKNVTLKVGENAHNYWFPFPGLRAYPLVLEVLPPQNDFKSLITYSYEME
ncbi:MAG: hypothetical protein MUE85_02400 [Microscillaceae bacterium]|jgi:hypothetical protein|nr:hypothetical protein [Microscillaceae bacterium]